MPLSAIPIGLGGGVSEPHRLLVVEDDPPIRAVLVEVLSDEGYQVQAVTDGTQALDALRCWIPDLILTDLMMPGMDGWTFRERLRRLDPPINRVPIVVVSGVTDLKEQARALGARAAIAKPFDLDEVVRTVRRILIEQRCA